MRRHTTLNSLRRRGQFSVFLFVLCLALSPAAKGQFEMPAMGARGAAMGGSSTALTDAASAMHNLAALASRMGVDIALSYRQNYLLQGMGHKWLAAGCSVSKTGTAIASYHHFGNLNYSEQRISIGYAQMVASRLSIGATIDYLYSGTADRYYDPMHGLTFTASLLLSLQDGWTLGARLFNPAAVRLGSDDNSRLPSQLNIGAAWQMSPEWTSTIEMEKTTYAPFCLRGGVEYTFFKHFCARVGIASDPMTLTFGLGVCGKGYAIDLAATVHQVLGLTPMVGGTLSL